MVIETKVLIGWFKLQFECDWVIELSDNKLSENTNCPIKKVSDYNLASELVANRCFYKSITIEQIVTFLIRFRCFRFFLNWFALFTKIITLTVFTKITLIKKRKEKLHEIAKLIKCDQNSIGFRVGYWHVQTIYASIRLISKKQ